MHSFLQNEPKHGNYLAPNTVKVRLQKLSTKGTNGSSRATRDLVQPYAQWFLRFSCLFITLSLLTAVLLVLRESGFYLFAIEGITASFYMIIFSIAGELADRRLTRLSILLYMQMVKSGLIETTFNEAIEMDST